MSRFECVRQSSSWSDVAALTLSRWAPGVSVAGSGGDAS